MKIVFECYLKCSIHVAFAVFSLTKITILSLQLPNFDDSILGFIFCSTIFFYNVMKYSHLKKVFFQISFNWLILVVSLFSFLFLIYFFFQIESLIKIQLFFIGIIAFIYPIFRKIKYLKMFFVAFCITFITAYIPILENQFPFIDLILFLFGRFLLVFCLLIPLEIADFETDKKTIKTIPHEIGIVKTKFIGYVFVLIIFVLNANWQTQIILLLIVSSIYISSRKISKYFTSFWVESIPIFGYFLFYFEKLAL